MVGRCSSLEAPSPQQVNIARTRLHSKRTKRTAAWAVNRRVRKRGTDTDNAADARTPPATQFPCIQVVSFGRQRCRSGKATVAISWRFPTAAAAGPDWLGPGYVRDPPPPHAASRCRNGGRAGLGKGIRLACWPAKPSPLPPSIVLIRCLPATGHGILRCIEYGW